MKSNCFKCEYYKVYDISSFGNKCRYKCIKKGIIEEHNIKNKKNMKECEEYNDRVNK